LIEHASVARARAVRAARRGRCIEDLLSVGDRYSTDYALGRPPVAASF
jgi:hypothetical protein